MVCGCIGAIDGTHIPVEVNQEAKADFINRDREVSINVCAIVDMYGRFTYVGAGKAGACHDMAVLQDCQADQRFPHPPPGLCLFFKLMMQQIFKAYEHQPSLLQQVTILTRLKIVQFL